MGKEFKKDSKRNKRAKASSVLSNAAAPLPQPAGMRCSSQDGGSFTRLKSIPAFPVMWKSSDDLSPLPTVVGKVQCILLCMRILNEMASQVAFMKLHLFKTRITHNYIRQANP